MYFLEENERLIDAAEIKNAKLVNQLIHYGADVNSRRDEGNGRFGHTALPEAASSGCLDAVKSLVSAGADLELTDDHFEEDPPLVRAAGEILTLSKFLSSMEQKLMVKTGTK